MRLLWNPKQYGGLLKNRGGIWSMMNGYMSELAVEEAHLVSDPPFDIIFAVNMMTSFTAEACWNHWKALLRILGYVGRTIHYGITYGGSNEHAAGVQGGGGNIDYYSIDHNIEGHVGSAACKMGMHSDSDYATDPRDSKRHSGVRFYGLRGCSDDVQQEDEVSGKVYDRGRVCWHGGATKAALWGHRLLAESGRERGASSATAAWRQQRGCSTNPRSIQHIENQAY